MDKIAVARFFLHFVIAEQNQHTESINSLLADEYEGFGDYDLQMLRDLYTSIREEDDSDEYDVLVGNVKNRLVLLINDFQEELETIKTNATSCIDDAIESIRALEVWRNREEERVFKPYRLTKEELIPKKRGCLAGKSDFECRSLEGSHKKHNKACKDIRIAVTTIRERIEVALESLQMHLIDPLLFLPENMVKLLTVVSSVLVLRYRK